MRNLTFSYGPVFFVLTLVVIGILILRGILFIKKFSRIRTGMTYDEVKNLAGQPKNSDTANGITTCVWSKAVLSGITLTRVIVFSNNQVVSVIKGK